jgi:tyrosinase
MSDRAISPRAAPNLFTQDFIGTSGPNGAVQFSNTNPLQFWVTDGVQGITRSPRNNWNPATQPGPTVITEAQTLALGAQYSAFVGMEGNPHGTAHTRWDGFIRSIDTAAKDPLFFLLHCNVDRLWAKWQKANARFDSTVAASFTGDPNNPIGHNLNDTMWPWNGVTGGSRPPTAPGGSLASSPCVTAPGTQPQVKSMLDYHGAINAASREGFDYDDVKFV